VGVYHLTMKISPTYLRRSRYWPSFLSAEKQNWASGFFFSNCSPTLFDEWNEMQPNSKSKWPDIVFYFVQGGIYTLPSHLSLGARDLIPRMLLVDPMKRITVPEIRQHAWFQNHLPWYLAVPPPDTVQQAKRVSCHVANTTSFWAAVK
jgi:serine/threonine protein kinase